MEFAFLHWIQGMRSPVMDEIMTAITFLGNGISMAGSGLEWDCSFLQFPEPGKSEPGC